MRNYRLTLFATLLFISPLITIAQQSPSAKEIMRKVEDKLRGESSKGEMVMKIVRPDWTREISMKMWSKDTEYSLVLITAPVRDKGSAFLKRDKEIWNWQPSIDRTIKLPPSMMMQSWMGSDFTNDDLVKESSIEKDYTHSIIKDTTVAGYKCWKLELIPTEEAAVVWGKIYTYVSKDDYIQLLSYFYDEDGYLVNTMVAGNIKELGGRTLAAKLEMIPADKEGQKTVMEYKSLEFGVPITEDFFSVQNMKRVR